MTNKNQTKNTKEAAGYRVLALSRAGTRGLLLQRELEQVVADLERAGVDQTEARYFLRAVFRVWKREASAEFHLRLRRATKAAAARQRPQLKLIPGGV